MALWAPEENGIGLLVEEADFFGMQDGLCCLRGVLVSGKLGLGQLYFQLTSWVLQRFGELTCFLTGRPWLLWVELRLFWRIGDV